jgi:hypothetical protein
MAAPTVALDKREPRGIIITTGTPRRAAMPFWAYLWGEDDEDACAGTERGRILESDLASDGLSPACRASP